MQPRLLGVPSYFLAFVAAPVAGAIAAILLTFVTTLLATGRLPDADDLPSMMLAIGFSAFLACGLFTLVVGACVILWVESRQRVPSLAMALTIGCSIAFCAAMLLLVLFGDVTWDALIVPLYATVCSLATAWAFWRVGLRDRTVAE